MNRRLFSRSVLATLPIMMSYTRTTLAAPTGAMSATRYIDSEHPSIRAAVEAIAPSSARPARRAIQIHDFVRDRIRFGWDSAFYDQSASEVLSSGIGFCNTKGTLFVTMLRAAGIPARQHFVNIHADVLTPFINPGTAYVDHSFTEVLLEERWLSVDSYIVDKPLFIAAQRRLIRESMGLGFGVHADGRYEWDGQSNAFSQFVTAGRFASLSTVDHGVFEDVGAFYASGKGVNKLNVLLQLGFGFFARGANRRIEALRRAA